MMSRPTLLLALLLCSMSNVPSALGLSECLAKYIVVKCRGRDHRNCFDDAVNYCGNVQNGPMDETTVTSEPQACLARHIRVHCCQEGVGGTALCHLSAPRISLCFARGLRRCYHADADYDPFPIFSTKMSDTRYRGHGLGAGNSLASRSATVSPKNGKKPKKPRKRPARSDNIMKDRPAKKGKGNGRNAKAKKAGRQHVLDHPVVVVPSGGVLGSDERPALEGLVRPDDDVVVQSLLLPLDLRLMELVDAQRSTLDPALIRAHPELYPTGENVVCMARYMMHLCQVKVQANICPDYDFCSTRHIYFNVPLTKTYPCIVEGLMRNMDNFRVELKFEERIVNLSESCRQFPGVQRDPFRSCVVKQSVTTCKLHAINCPEQNCDGLYKERSFDDCMDQVQVDCAKQPDQTPWTSWPVLFQCLFLNMDACPRDKLEMTGCLVGIARGACAQYIYPSPRAYFPMVLPQPPNKIFPPIQYEKFSTG